MSQPPVFSPRTVFWLILVSVLSFGGAGFFLVSGVTDAVTSHGATGFSYSNIGHRALIETLRRLDIPVVVSRARSTEKTGATSLLIIAEPERRHAGGGALTQLLTATHVLLVLPKWRGPESEEKRGWIASARPVSVRETEWVLHRAVPDGNIRRIGFPPTTTEPTFAATPSLDTTQLMTSSRLKPILATEQGMLIGEIFRGTSRIWVLSDPDILSNRGLGRDDNAVLALAMIDELRGPGGTVVFDETTHGFEQEPNLWRALFQLPFLVATVHAIVAIIALLLAAVGRFGAPIPVAKPLAAGKAALLNNTASLLQYGGHGPEILRRYLEVVFREVARRLHMPHQADEAARIAWIDRLGRARGLAVNFSGLRQDTEMTAATAKPRSPRLLHAAQKLYRWKQEILHGR